MLFFFYRNTGAKCGAQSRKIRSYTNTAIKIPVVSIQKVAILERFSKAPKNIGGHGVDYSSALQKILYKTPLIFVKPPFLTEIPVPKGNG